MRRHRITIAGLLGLVLFLAVGLAALRSADDAWDSGVLGVTLAVLLISVLLAVHRTGHGRAYWLGFALFGWLYLVVSLVPTIEARLPTAKALSYLGSKVSEDLDGWDLVVANDSAGRETGEILVGTTVYVKADSLANARRSNRSEHLYSLLVGGTTNGLNGTAENFVRIGHSLFALAFALVGGLISRRLYHGPETTRWTSGMAVIDVGGRDDRGGPGDLADDPGTPL